MNRRIGIIPEFIAIVIFVLLALTNNAFAVRVFPWPMFLPAIISNGKITESCIVGEWLRVYDWSCDGNTNYIIDQIKADHTWNSSSGTNGTWKLIGTDFTYYYPIGTIYSGSVDSTCTSMSGTMITPNGLTGCWSSSQTASNNRSDISKKADEKEASPLLNDLDDAGMQRK